MERQTVGKSQFRRLNRRFWACRGAYAPRRVLRALVRARSLRQALRLRLARGVLLPFAPALGLGVRVGAERQPGERLAPEPSSWQAEQCGSSKKCTPR